METDTDTTQSGRSLAASAGSPLRVQLRRQRGWRMPQHTKVVDRRTIYGNPFPVGDGYQQYSQRDAVTLFERWLEGKDVVPPFGSLPREFVLREIRKLKGYNLACWCKPETPCHADVLLRWANT